MIAAFSTSSRLASVALFENGVLIGSSEQDAPTNASGACLEMLRSLIGAEWPPELRDFAADTGPGSFIGARVAVTLAKTLAFARGGTCYGAMAFDLITRDGCVAVPNKRGEWFVRAAGGDISRAGEVPAGCLGYGEGIREPVFPHASRFAALLGDLEAVAPEALLPTYLAEPSISMPKKPYAGGAR